MRCLKCLTAALLVSSAVGSGRSGSVERRLKVFQQNQPTVSSAVRTLRAGRGASRDDREQLRRLPPSSTAAPAAVHRVRHRRCKCSRAAIAAIRISPRNNRRPNEQSGTRSGKNRT